VWAIACWCIVREKPEDKGWRPIAVAEDALPASIDDPPKAKLSQRLSMVLTEPGFWLVTLSLFFSGGALMTFQGLWAIPYLMDVHGYSRVQSGSLLMVIPLGFMIGAPAFGFLTDRWEMDRKRILLYALGLALGCWTIILLAGSAPPFFLLLPLFLILGACGGGSTAIHMTIMKELFPAWLTGTAVGLLNTAAFLSTAVIQPLTGVLMDVVGRKGSAYPVEAYSLVFLTSWVCTGIAVIVLSVWPLSQKILQKDSSPKYE
jgi:MFS family permease